VAANQVLGRLILTWRECDRIGSCNSQTREKQEAEKRTANHADPHVKESIIYKAQLSP